MSQYFDIVTGELIEHLEVEEEDESPHGFNEKAFYALNRESAGPTRMSSFARRRQTNAGRFNNDLAGFVQALNAPVHRSVSQTELVVERRKQSLEIRVRKLKDDKIRNITLNVLVTFVF